MSNVVFAEGKLNQLLVMQSDRDACVGHFSQLDDALI